MSIALAILKPLLEFLAGYFIAQKQNEADNARADRNEANKITSTLVNGNWVQRLRDKARN